MSFALRLAQDLVGVEPGASVPIALTVTNRTETLDRFELELDGIDPEWKAIPVPVFTVEPGIEHSERIFIRPPRASESLAGNYPFVVRVRSLESGESKTVQGVLAVSAFHHVSMEISPKKGHISPARKQNSFTITVVNLGNTEHRIQFQASDPEDHCAFEFEHDQITIGPGQQREVELIADPTSNPILSSGRLIGFSVTGRSLDVPSVVTTAQAQLEQRSLLSPTSLGVLVVFAVLFGFWLLNMPKPPSISLMVDRSAAVRGDTVQVSWKASNASTVRIAAANGDIIYDGSMTSGTRTYVLKDAGAIDIHAEAGDEGRKAVAKDVTIAVEEPEVVPEPKITLLKPDKTKVKLGQTFVLSYAFNDAVTKATLGPSGENLDPALSSLEIRPSRTGTIQYEVVATNKEGKTTKRQFTIEVIEESDAKILDFHPSSPIVATDSGTVTLLWQVTNAVRVEIKANGGEPIQVEPQGSQDFPVTAKTTFTLIAFDAQARKATQTIVVNIRSGDPIPAPGTESTTGISPSTTTTGEAPPATTGSPLPGGTTGR
jgi:hypothetical protein